MERREFLHITGLSLGGFMLMPGSLGFDNRQAFYMQWWGQFQQLAGARLMRSVPDSLDELLKKQLQTRAYRDFREVSGSWRQFGQGKYACCAIELRHAQAGLLDFSAAVFEKTALDEWRPLTMLSSFHLEAIALLEAKAEWGPDTADYVLPVGGYTSGPQMGAFYHTNKGSFGVAPQYGAEGMKLTTLAINKRGVEIFRNTWLSTHQLV